MHKKTTPLEWTISVCPEHGTVALHMGAVSLRFTRCGFESFVESLLQVSEGLATRCSVRPSEAVAN
jgi:hypothetical protein